MAEPLAHTVSGFNAAYFVEFQGLLETINCIIDWMRELKVGFEDSEKVSETALCGAWSRGHFADVQILIELGVGVEKQSNYAGMSPAASRLLKTVQKLVYADADPLRPNAYGHNAMATLLVIILLLISLFSSGQDITQWILHFVKSICEKQSALLFYQYLFFRFCQCLKMNTTGVCLY